MALKYKVQHLIDAGWLTFQEDRPNVKTNPLANHGGGAVNAVGLGKPRRSKPLKDVTTPRRFIYEVLQKGGVIPHSGHEEDSCLLHHKKVKAILEMPEPRTERQVRGFLGHLNYIARFISQFIAICEPLFKLLWKQCLQRLF